MKHRKTELVTPCALLLITMFAFAGCSRNQSAQTGVVPQMEAPVFAVNTTLAVQGQLRNYLALTGDIVSGSTVDTFSDAAGKVTRVYVSNGSRVSRGDAIAAIDPSRPGMDYVASIARAPISGTVVSLPAQVGMTVSQAVPLARIAGGSALEIRLFVAERDISKIAVNLPCEIALDAYPGEVFQGSVSEVSPTVDAASRTMEIRVNVRNPGSRLKAGMFAKVRVITERKNNIVKVPSAALIQRFGESYVFVAENDDSGNRIARRQAVTVGILVDGVLEIQQGLSPDDEVIVRGQSLLEDGARINVIDHVAPLSAD